MLFNHDGRSTRRTQAALQRLQNIVNTVLYYTENYGPVLARWPTETLLLFADEISNPGNIRCPHNKKVKCAPGPACKTCVERDK